MDLKPTNFDISWFLDQHRQGRLNLSPPYQRKSVWGPKDRRFFMDTIFRGYPAPPIYLHKETKDDGTAIWHVVDGKQRLTSILKFVENKFALGKEFGDERLDGKRWKNLSEYTDIKTKFWDYTFLIQIVPQADTQWIQEVFDRLNRNSKNLYPQELRHAKFDGWFVNFVETQAEKNPVWADLKVVTTGRARRMQDVQFISELARVNLKNEIVGFDQEQLDELYADYEKPEDLDPILDLEQFEADFHGTLSFIDNMRRENEEVLQYLKTYVNFYSLWSLVALNDMLVVDVSEFTNKYLGFMGEVEKLKAIKDLEDFVGAQGAEFENVYSYFKNARGASTEYPQRKARHIALSSELLKSP